MDTMNSRQRFQSTMGFGKPDRPPLFEEGLRKEVLAAWRKQGLPRKSRPEQLFSIDARDEIEPDLWPRPYPAKWPKNLTDLDDLRRRLDPDEARRYPQNWGKLVSTWKDHQQVVMLRVQRGFFQSIGIQDWGRFEEAMLIAKDKPQVVRGMMKIQGEFCAQVADRILREVEVDAAVFSEPIGGNHGPLISPLMYRDLALTGYLPILEVLRRYRVQTIILRTYANCRALIPCILEAGFNCLWAVEVYGNAMDYRDLRREFGPDLRLIGGIDLDVLRSEPNAIRRELEEKAVPLLEQGGYIPLADGRVREDVPWENYRYYREALERIVSEIYPTP